MKELEKKLLEDAKKLAKEEMEKVIKEQEERLLGEVEELKRLLGEIKNNLLYKRVDSQYVLITEKILFADYQTDNRYQRKKIVYNTDFKENRYYVSVSGERYFHIGEIITNHLRDIDKAIRLNDWEREQLNKKRDVLERLENQHKNIIEMYNAYEKSLEGVIHIYKGSDNE